MINLAGGRRALAGSSITAVVALLAIGSGNAGGLHELPKLGPAKCRYLERGEPGPAGNWLEVRSGNATTIELERVEERIRVNKNEGPARHTEVRCTGGRPTVTNVDGILVAPPPRVFLGMLAIDLRDGPLGPGATPEPNGGEIEVVVPERRPVGDVSIVTGGADDRIVLKVGRRGLAADLDAHGSSPEVDMEIPVLFGVAVSAGGGDDIVTSIPRRGLGGAFVRGGEGDDVIKGGLADGGEGNDRLLGSPSVDLMVGGRGRDVLRGYGAPDLLASFGGRDLIDAGPGRDLIFTADRDRDKVLCGPARDLALIDFHDKRSGCERIRIRKSARAKRRPRINRLRTELRNWLRKSAAKRP